MRIPTAAALAALVAVLLVIASPAPSSLASWPGRDGAIVFASDGGISTMSPNGFDSEPLTQPDDTNPKWSADGTMIAFERGPEVWVMNGYGTDQRLIREGQHPTWTTDGRLLLIFGGEILKVNLNGQTLANLTNTPNVTESEAVMSPDGTMIAYSSDEDPNEADPQNPTAGLTLNLWLMDPDGQNRRILWQQDNGTYDSQIDWAPDSSRVAFVDAGDVWTSPPDANNQTDITNDAALQGHPTWSPDGKLIAYDEDVGLMQSQIFAIDVDTRQTRLLSQDANADDREPHWQPWLVQNGRIWYLTGFGFDTGDGVASSEPDGSHRVVPFSQVRPDGGGFPVFVNALAWSPDGTKLAASQVDNSQQPPVAFTFVVSPTDELVGAATGALPSWYPDNRRVVTSREDDLWMNDTATLNPGNPVNLTNTANNVRELDSAVSPDGRWLAFSSNESPGGDPQNPTAGNNFDMYLMDAEGAPPDRMPIVQSATYQGSPTWSPDGTRVAYADNGDIWTVDPFNPIDRVNLTSDALFQSDPDWSPDGRFIAFGQKSGIIANESQVWTINVQSKQRARVTKDVTITEGKPDWHPLFAPGSDGWFMWGDNTCSGAPSLDSVLATLYFLAGLEPQRRPACPHVGQPGLTSTNTTTEWGNLDCESGVDGRDVLAGIAYTIEMEVPVHQEPAGGIQDACPPLDTYIQWLPLD